MNINYSNDPLRIGKYFSNKNVLVTSANRLHTLNPFENHQLLQPTQASDPEIMTIKPRSSVPEQFEQTGTRISKSCNLPGININRFENPHPDIQNPTHIIADEQFRGGMPSRIVMKDEYIQNQK